MPPTPSADLAELAAELDKAHERGRAAYRARDLSACVNAFAPDLVYRDAKGRVITRERLGRDLQNQLEHLIAADSGFARESLAMEGPLAIEVGTQTARLAVRIALVFARRWSIHRRGRYTWRRSPDGWVISAVEVLEERVTGDGFGLAKAAV